MTTKKEKSDKPKDIVITGEYMDKVIRTKGLALLSNRELPVKLSYWLSRIVVKIESEFKVYQEKRKQIIERFQNKDSDGNPKFADKAKTIPDISEEKIPECEKELEELASVEITLSGYHQFEMNPDKLVSMLEEKDIMLKAVEFTAVIPLFKE